MVFVHVTDKAAIKIVSSPRALDGFGHIHAFSLAHNRGVHTRLEHFPRGTPSYSRAMLCDV
jgi:hypothetical protein